MTRIDIVNNIISSKAFTNYLEIGVYKGECFLNIKCKNKTGVDPNFLIDPKKKHGHILFDRKNYGNKYFEMYSDDYFVQQNTALSHNPIELCFIDGLHTFKQSLNDVLNALKYLKKGGFIVMHDCNPPNLASAAEIAAFEDGSVKEIEGWTGEWCGDVWKTIVFIKKTFPQLSVAVANCDYGVGIIKYDSNINLDIQNFEAIFNEVKAIEYQFLNTNRVATLNLIEPQNIVNFIA